MAKKVMSLRVDDELAAWLDAEAKAEGVTRTDLIESLVRRAMEGLPSQGGRPRAAFVHGGAAPVSAPRPRRIETPEDARQWAWERQQKLNKARGL